jgi:hypothetical protein
MLCNHDLKSKKIVFIGNFGEHLSLVDCQSTKRDIEMSVSLIEVVTLVFFNVNDENGHVFMHEIEYFLIDDDLVL